MLKEGTNAMNLKLKDHDFMIFCISPATIEKLPQHILRCLGYSVVLRGHEPEG